MNAAQLALFASGTFVALLATVHLLKPELDPSWQFISEYAIGRHGWIMRAAFLSLAVANVGVWLALRPFLRSRWGYVGSCLFLIGTVGVVLGGLFVTDPINTAPEARTTSGNLHNLGGALGLAGFLGTLIFSGRLLRHESWRTARMAVGLATAILVLGFLVSFVSISVIAAQHQGVFGPDTPVGWPNRIGILSGCVWLAIIATLAARQRQAS